MSFGEKLSSYLPVTYETTMPIQNNERILRAEGFTHVFGGVLIIIAALASAGVLSGGGAGGAILVLSIPLWIGNIIAYYKFKDDQKQRASAIARIFVHLLAIVLGSLAIAGTVSVSIVGAVVLTTVTLAHIFRCYVDCRQRNGGSAPLSKLLYGTIKNLLPKACREIE